MRQLYPSRLVYGEATWGDRSKWTKCYGCYGFGGGGGEGPWGGGAGLVTVRLKYSKICWGLSKSERISLYICRRLGKPGQTTGLRALGHR